MRILTSDGQFFVNANYEIEEKMGEPPQLTCSIPFSDNRWIESVKELDRVFTDNEQDEFVIINPTKIAKGDTYELSITAVGGFQFDFAKSFLPGGLGSGTFSFHQLIAAVFEGTNYHAELNSRLSDREKLRFENFGDDNRFKLLERALNRFGAEYKVVGRTVYFDDEVGSDTGFQFRYLKNIRDTEYSIDATNLATSIRGKGAEISEGVPLRVEYTSPLAEIYGKLDYGEISDERMTNKEALLEKCKKTLDASISVTLKTTLVSLKRQEFGEVAHIGDFIWFIDERINLEKKMRFNSVKTYYLSDDSILKQEVVLGDKDAFDRYKNAETQQSQNIVNAVEDIRKIAKDAFVVANGGHTIYHSSEFIKDEPKGLLKEGDILFLDTGDEVLLYFWDGVEWKRQRLGLDDELKKEYDDQVNALKKEIDKLTQRDEDSLAEFDKKIADLRKQSLTPEAIDKALEEAGFKDSMDDIRKQLSTVSQTAKVNAELIGGDGTTSYNKNRLLDATSQDVTGDYIEVGHNGDGFEVGKSYVISWSAVCRPYGRQDVAVEVLTTFVGSGAVKLVPVDTRFPTIDKKLTKKSDSLLEVYLGQYRASFSGDWYQPVNELVTITDKQASWQVRPSFKTVADGQSAMYDGEWSDTPTLIFDGGRS